ncbi:MAG: GNAT family N-acetyltransferase [Bacilli bacterium]
MIRKVNLEDIDSVVKFLKEEIEDFDEDVLKEELGNIDNSSLIYEENSKIFGFSIAIIRNRELKRGEVILYVSEINRRNGIGGKLYLYAQDYLKKIDVKYIRIEIRTEKNYTGDFLINRGLNKWFGYNKMLYSGGKLTCNIQLVNYNDNYYEKYKKVCEECFFKMRKELGFEPYRVCSSRENLMENKSKIFLLLDGEEVICSVLLSDNEIDDLIVNEKYRRQGYAKKLINFSINYYQTSGVKNIYLGVTDWNVNAIKLYEDSGFNIVSKCEVYRSII